MNFKTPMPPTPAPALSGEPERVSIQTLIPGPASEALRARHQKYQEARTVHFYQDARKSFGNYSVDVDGNVLLEMYGHIAALPLGYNHPDLIAAWKNGDFDWAAGYRPALGIAPSAEWVEIVENTLAKVAPKGLPKVVTVTTGSEAVENAMKAAFMRLAYLRRKGSAHTAADLQGVMVNAQPEINQLKVVSFEGGFHGRSMGALSATRSKPIHKLDVPAFEWPVVPFPANKFPYSEHAAENQEAEARSLEQLEALFAAHPMEIAALLVEPIQGEGGDRQASHAYYRALRALTLKHHVAMIVDEVQTGGGASGTFWAHEQWGLETPPDLMTFSKKMQIGGFYCREEFLPHETFRIFNTFLGDPLRAAQLGVIVNVIERDHLLENVRVTGEYLTSGLWEVAHQYPQLLSNVRGKGTFLAIDVKDTATREKLLYNLRQKGLEMGGSGDRSIRFRPALVFAPRHAAEFLQIFADGCRELA